MTSLVLIANRLFSITNSRSNLIRALLDKGLDVYILCSKDSLSSPSQLDSRVKYIPIPFTSSFHLASDIRAFIQLLLFLRSTKPLYILTYNLKPLLFVAYIKPLLNLKSRIVSTITGFGFLYARSSLYRLILHFSLSLSSHSSTTLVTQNNSDYSILRHLGLNNKLLLNFPGSGIDTSKYPYHEDHDDTQDKPLSILMVGRLLYQKGFLDFLNIARTLYPQFKDQISFTWIGEHDMSHPDSVSSADIEASSRFIDIVPFTSGIIYYYNTSDLLLFTSHREGLPRSVLEAASTGLPVLAYDVPGIQDLASRGICQTVPFNSRLMIEWISNVMFNRDDLPKRSKHISNLVHQSYDQSVIVDLYLKVLDL